MLSPYIEHAQSVLKNRKRTLSPKATKVPFQRFCLNESGQECILFFLFHKMSLRARRKPRLLFVFEGVLLFRFATRQFLAELFQLPPRFTRLEPLQIHSLFCRHMSAEASCACLVYERHQTTCTDNIFFLFNIPTAQPTR